MVREKEGTICKRRKVVIKHLKALREFKILLGYHRRIRDAIPPDTYTCAALYDSYTVRWEPSFKRVEAVFCRHCKYRILHHALPSSFEGICARKFGFTFTPRHKRGEIHGKKKEGQG